MARSSKPIPALSEKDKLRFFSKISTVPTERGCLEWTAAKMPKGYGVFQVRGVVALSHRIARFLDTGTDPLELLVCHTCDNTSCCTPEHLWVGTYADNNRDKSEKGRAPSGDANGARLHPERIPRGVKNGLSKLDDARVLLIRADQRVQREIAKTHGVSPSLICLVKQRKIWTHVA
jgi:hypothetical protein